MIRSTKDFWSGLIYICLGSSAMIIAQDYSMGTAVKMGPAYFPTILGGLLVLIGTISVIRSFVVTGTPIGAFAFKGLALIIGSTLLFGFLVRGAGLIVALPLLVIAQRLRQHAFSLETDDGDGVWADAVLRSGVHKRLGCTVADYRLVVWRLTMIVIQLGVPHRGIAESSGDRLAHRSHLG